MKAWETATERLIDAGMLRQMIRSNSHIERLGPPPIINHFMARMGLDDVLARHVSSDARCAVPHARALCVLLRVEREPIHHQQKTVNGFAAGMFGIAAEEMQHLGDDRLGCALDRLFDADRAALLTDVMTGPSRMPFLARMGCASSGTKSKANSGGRIAWRTSRSTTSSLVRREATCATAKSTGRGREYSTISSMP